MKIERFGEELSMLKKTRVILPALVGAVLFFSCSYHLVREGRGSLPSGLTSISVPLAENRTMEAGLEDMFTQELIKRLRADGRVEVMAPGQADAELRCTLKSLNTWPVSYSPEGKIFAERVSLGAECALVIPESESVVWKSGSLSAAEEYGVSDDYLLNEEAKARALLEAARDISEHVRSTLLDPF